MWQAGQWKVRRNRISVEAGRVHITQTLGAPRAVLEQNARLIAAAPDLYAALEDAKELIAADGWRAEDALGGETVRVIDQALLLARGGRKR